MKFAPDSHPRLSTTLFFGISVFFPHSARITLVTSPKLPHIHLIEKKFGTFLSGTNQSIALSFNVSLHGKLAWKHRGSQPRLLDVVPREFVAENNPQLT